MTRRPAAPARTGRLECAAIEYSAFLDRTRDHGEEDLVARARERLRALQGDSR
jgi:hypothetical protein